MRTLCDGPIKGLEAMKKMARAEKWIGKEKRRKQ